MPVNDPRLLGLHAELANHLDAISRLFKPGAKLTLVVRNPGAAGDAGVVIGDDDLDAAIGEIERRKAESGAGPGTGRTPTAREP